MGPVLHRPAQVQGEGFNPIGDQTRDLRVPELLPFGRRERK
jgi:hypothetical protein